MDIGKLQELISRLTPEAQVRGFATRHDDARAAFKFSRSTVADEREFEHAITRYFQHHEEYITGKRLSDGEALHDAEEALERAFYREHGMAGARREGIRSSDRGGMRYIFDCLAEALKEKHRRIYCRRVISEYLSISDYDSCEDCLNTLEARLGELWPDMPKRIRVEMALGISSVLEGTAQLPKYILKFGARR